MPEIIITTADRARAGGTEVHRERIHAADVETETASHLLVERIGWALSDADKIEHEHEHTAPGRLTASKAPRGHPHPSCPPAIGASPPVSPRSGLRRVRGPTPGAAVEHVAVGAALRACRRWRRRRST